MLRRVNITQLRSRIILEIRDMASVHGPKLISGNSNLKLARSVARRVSLHRGLSVDLVEWLLIEPPFAFDVANSWLVSFQAQSVQVHCSNEHIPANPSNQPADLAAGQPPQEFPGISHKISRHFREFPFP